MATIKHIEMLYLTQPQIKGYTIEAWGIIIYHNVQAHFPHGKYSKKIFVAFSTWYPKPSFGSYFTNISTDKLMCFAILPTFSPCSKRTVQTLV